jgi:hypothetical protein
MNRRPSNPGKLFLVVFTLVLAQILVALSSCKDTITDPDQPINVVFPDSNVSYSQHVEPLFQQGCAFGQCHGSNSAGGLNLESPSYSKLLSRPGLVVSRESNNSLLVQRLDGRLQPRMPLNRTQLTQNQVNGIKKWIDEGAANN